ncbi:SDR family NAD(P)-dependent oxidoreductase [Pseudomonas bohemica]|uniref:SDR family NAD(P)-dependent oxidoreductase n=1 Tax=Pseudomonas bohemica TaxID=2044872 RepID=UPI000DA620D5|nr:SDR family NAD(P)-dependent oxidoreductase [Pseudomonas bohemica]
MSSSRQDQALEDTPIKAKVIVVTGGFGVLGSALGQHLSTRGARIALLDRAEATQAKVSANGSVLALGGVDLTSVESANAALRQVAERFGRIDGLVNVAGGFAWETLEGGSLATWDHLYQMNLRTAVVASQAVLAHLVAAQSGRIVNVSAQASVKAGMGMGAYAASKAGVARLTEALAEELKDRRITVNAVLPSIIDTPTNRTDMPDADFSRWVSPTQLASVIAFLLSDDADAVTGACLPVSGRV